MTSAARIAANRRNALASTGPRTGAGKARSAQNARLSTGPRTPAGKAASAQNARRHGLTLSVAGDPAWSEAIQSLARSIAGADADAEGYDLACLIAEADIGVMRARRARADLCAAVAAAPGEGDRIVRLAAVGDYEQRALARRKFAIREFDAHLEWRSRKQAEPNPPRAEGIRENEPNPTSVATIRENEPNPTPAAATRENEPNPMPAAGPLPVNPSGGGRHRGRELREHPGADQVAAQKAGASAPIVGGTVVSALRESPLLRLG
jgi:hypothetical protein